MSYHNEIELSLTNKVGRLNQSSYLYFVGQAK